jgi:mannitol/fructose-specific phosphotransferase system IIA component
MHTTNECRNDVRILGIELIVYAEGIGLDPDNEVQAVL